MSHIFISYSKQDKDYARKLVGKLRDEGFDVWIDDRLRNSEDWWNSIVLAIWKCSAFIVILTPKSDASRWVQREIAVADGRGKPIFPLLLEGDLNTPNWALFVRTQYTDVTGDILPPPEFYNDLAKQAPRKAERGSDVTATAEHQAVVIDDMDFRFAVQDVPDDDNGGRRLPRYLIALGLIVALVLAGFLTIPRPTETTITPTTPITEPTTGVPTPDPLTTPATIEALNTWRTANGFTPLSVNAQLDVIANVHLNYLTSIPIDDLPGINLYIDAQGQDISAMAAQAGYPNAAQMFVDVGDTEMTMAALLNKLQSEGSPDLQTQAREAGWQTFTSPDTGKHYTVLILGWPNS